MSKKLVKKLLLTAAGAGFLMLVAAGGVDAFGFGMDGVDTILTNLETGITGSGILIGLIGGAGMVYAKMEQTYSPLFAGFLPYFMSAGVLGSLAAVLGVMGLTTGATLPLV